MRTFFLFIIVLLTISCSKTKEEDYADQFEAYYVKNMNDPDSYELVDVSILPGLTSHAINRDNVRLLFAKKDNISTTEFDSLYKDLTKNQHTVYFKIRGANNFGAKVLSIIDTYFIDGKLRYVEGEEVY